MYHEIQKWINHYKGARTLYLLAGFDTSLIDWKINTLYYLRGEC